MLSDLPPKYKKKLMGLQLHHGKEGGHLQLRPPCNQYAPRKPYLKGLDHIHSAFG
jgi:hypothetical protein